VSRIPTTLALASLAAFALAGSALAQAAPTNEASRTILKSSPGDADLLMAKEVGTNPPPAPASGQLWQRTEQTTDPTTGVKTTTTVIASPPVPDTKENRARYGGPDSKGKLTKEEPPVGR
jgi:hypothetical protein